ncbi:MAG: type II toxin-antitoxin system HicA family toxin [Phycisphaeraceae bacterium]
MSKLPTDLSGREVRGALERAGFIFRRQTGSHMVLRRDDPYARAVVPDHKQIRMGTLRRILADAGLTADQFMVTVHGFKNGVFDPKTRVARAKIDLFR